MNPGLIFLLLFIGVPLIELYFMIEVGSQIGAIPTISLVVFTAVLGGLLVRLQGFSTLMRVREMTERGEIPAVEMLEGAVLLLAGFSLLLPGFFTDALGFLCLVPKLRRWAIITFLQRASIIQPGFRPPHDKPHQHKPHHPHVIEGECQREENNHDKG